MAYRAMITRPNFLTLNRRTFSFMMTDHLNPQIAQNTILRDICQTITGAYQARFPIWARLLGGHRIFLIPPQHRLFQYLDQDSKNKLINFLIFQRQGNGITVTHFGPFGNIKENDFKIKISITQRALQNLKQRWNALKSPGNKMSEEEKDRERDRIIGELMKNYWAKVLDFESKIASKKEQLKDLLHRVFDDEQEIAEDLIEKLMASSGKVMIKAVTEKIAKKVAAKIAAKTAAKVAATTGARAAGKAAAKAVPVVGAVLGLGFGIWRLCHGDVTGAGLEVTSGAASCVPGGGTAASLTIDAGIVARDVYLARQEIKRIAEVNCFLFSFQINNRKLLASCVVRSRIICPL